jgi:cytochrome c553
MKMFQHQALTIASAIGFLLFATASHADVDAHSRNLASHCAACHGTNGYSVGGTPVIAGLDKALFVSQMKDFKSGARPSTVMHNHAKGYTDEEFERLADFFAAQKR